MIDWYKNRYKFQQKLFQFLTQEYTGTNRNKHVRTNYSYRDTQEIKDKKCYEKLFCYTIKDYA